MLIGTSQQRWDSQQHKNMVGNAIFSHHNNIQWCALSGVSSIGISYLVAGSGQQFSHAIVCASLLFRLAGVF